MDLFSTDTLRGIVESLPSMSNTLVQRYFPTQLPFDTEAVHWDRVDRKRRVAPYCHPQAPAKVSQSAGYSVDSFTPAYVKDLRRFDPQRALKRLPGEALTGSLSPAERINQLVAQDLAEQKAMLERRLELQAVEVLRTGKITVVGDDYPSTVVDFQRASQLTPANLSSTAKWDAPTTAVPLDNLETWAGLTARYGNVYCRDAIMSTATWQTMRACSQVKDEFDLRWMTNASVTPDGKDDEGLIQVGSARGFRFFIYTAWWSDEAGSETAMLADGDVVLTSPSIEGVQAYGAIQDLASLQATPYFVKMYDEENPSVRFMLFQSAPLLVPVRKNVSLKVKVY